MTKAKKKSKTYQAIEKCYIEILRGAMLCVDPSTGSKSSKPGFAWYEKGKLVESGEITVDLAWNRSEKLYEISRTIREEFDEPDILVVEYIPPVMYHGKGHGMDGVSRMALQKAIGAIMAARPFKHLLEIPASAWRAHKPTNYVKSDEWDSIVIGLCAVNTAKLIEQEQE